VRYTAFKYVPVEKDAELAAAWFLRAAKGGCADAMDNLGNCLKNGDGVEKDVELSFAWYLKAARKGLASAMHHLSLCYGSGIGCEKDAEKAEEWRKKAEECGYVEKNSSGW
jgi:uncharacterized protein